MRSDTFLNHPALSRYLAGDVTPDEQRAVDQWLTDHPEERRMVDALRVAVPDPYGSVPDYNADARVAATVDYSIRAARRHRREGFTASHSRHRENPDSTLFPVQNRRMPARTFWYTLTAAAAMVITGWSLIGYLPNRPSSSVSTYTTSNGERATITLPDGSTVLLNVASRLEVPTDYDRGNRAIKLTGEAHFTVIPRTTAPFTVTTGQHTTRVLGTTFIVREYPTDTATTVAVRDGKVAIGPVVLTAGQETVVGRTGTPQVQMTSASRFAFVRGSLAIEDLSLSDAISELNRWYDADIRLSDPALATQRVIGTFETGSLTDLISIMELTFNVRVVREGRVLTLYPRG